MQGSSAPIRLRHSARDLADGAGLLTVRRLWDELDLGRWIDDRSADVAGRFCTSLMMERWVALLLYGGSVLDDLLWFSNPGVRALFGWTRIPDPTTFGCWLRRAGEPLVPILDELIWHLVRVRWEATEVPRTVTLVLDSTVAHRYGTRQAGAEKGNNPKKRGRPSHHPLVATLAETGDLLGVRWRPGSASAAKVVTDWLEALVARLREAGVEEIAQLGAGRTSVDDLGGNALLWPMAALACQLLHVLRTTAHQGAWRRAQPNRIRAWLFRLPGKLTRHARKLYVQHLRREPLRAILLQALRRVAQLRAPPDQLVVA